MKALGLVLLFWAFVGCIFAWALCIAAAINAGSTPLVVVLLVIPFAALSAFLWWVFSELEA